MKISKIALGSLASAFVLLLTLSTSFANMGEMRSERIGDNFSEEHFNEMKQMFLNNDYESFKAQMEIKRAERQTEQKKFQENVTRTTENIDNGVVMTLTSDDADVVTHLQERKEREPRDNENVQKTIENLSNGVRITITSDDAEIVTRLQTKKEFGMKRGGGKNSKKGKGLRQQKTLK